MFIDRFAKFMLATQLYVVDPYLLAPIRVKARNSSAMNFMRTLEPKFSTLIQAAVIAFLLVAISFIYENEDKASAERHAVAIAGK